VLILDAAVRELAAGDADAALSSLAEARRAGLSLDYPDTARRYYRTLAMARYRTGRYTEALPAFEKALELDPENEELRQAFANARRRVTPS
jgi:tetratricopeptide (TPR) repeat protein